MDRLIDKQMGQIDKYLETLTAICVSKCVLLADNARSPEQDRQINGQTDMYIYGQEINKYLETLTAICVSKWVLLADNARSPEQDNVCRSLIIEELGARSSLYTPPASKIEEQLLYKVLRDFHELS